MRENEKIKKGLKNLEKNEEKNMIKILSYVSKINKNIKESKIISRINEKFEIRIYRRRK